MAAALTLLVVATTPAHAQTVVDDTAAAVDPAMLAGLNEAIGDVVRDPLSTQLRDLAPGDEGAICGELNTRNGFGAYMGFVPFAFVEGGDLRVYDVNDPDYWIAGGMNWLMLDFAGCAEVLGIPRPTDEELDRRRPRR